METIEKYKSSYPLQTEFVRSVDGCGQQIFTQIRRVGNFCLYKRTKLDGQLIGYELFRTILVKANNGLQEWWGVKNDYERYPVASDFGRIAKFIGGINAEARADEMFEKWINNPKIEFSQLI